MNVQKGFIMRTIPRSVAVAFAIALSACSQGRQQQGAMPQVADRTQSLALNSLSTRCALQQQSLGPGGVRVTVAGVSPTDSWASVSPSATGDTVHLYHYNGTSWSSGAVPVIPGSTNWSGEEITSIEAIASNDVWALGAGISKSGGIRPYYWFILHWNGSVWSVFPNPTDFQYYTDVAPAIVSADASNDVWISGSTQNPNGSNAAVLQHWNGTKWSGTPIPYPAGVGGVAGLKAFSASDVWLLPSEFGLIYHWNGATVTAQKLPPLNGTSPGTMYAVDGTKSSDLWVSGATSNPSNPAYIAHHSASWSPFVVNTGHGTIPSDASVLLYVLPFRYGYAVGAQQYYQTAQGGNVAADLLVYNNVDRWRPTYSPFDGTNPTGSMEGYWLGSGVPKVIKGTTSFWLGVSYNGASGASFPAAVTCPNAPPPPAP